MPTRECVIEIQGPSGPLNSALNVWQYASGGPADDVVLTQILAFTTSVLAQTAQACSVISARMGFKGGPLAYQVWPTAVVTNWNTQAAAPVYEVQQAFFGDPITGNGDGASLGTSITVTEQTVLGGRHNGRKFIPWIAASTLDAAGAVATANAAFVADVYTYCCLGVDPATGDPIGGSFAELPLVAGVDASSIVGVRVSTTPARLRSRIR